MGTRGAAVLAGGEGRRFKVAGGRGDKALFKIEGKPMVVRVLEAVKEVVDEVIVVVDSWERAQRFAPALSDVRIVVDEEGPRGPLTGIRTGLRKLRAESCLITPCDVPFIKGAALNELLRKLEEGVEGVVPLWPNGFHEPLIAAYKREPALRVGDLLGKLGRTRPDDLVRAGLEVEFLSVREIRKVDPDLDTFVNINKPSDLESRRPLKLSGELDSVRLRHPMELQEVAKLVEEAVAQRRASVVDDGGVLFWSALLRRVLAKSSSELIEAATWYRREAELYDSLGLRLLRARALIDAYRCLEEGGVKADHLMKEALGVYRELGVDRKDL